MNPPQRFSPSYRVWLLAVLVATYACSFIDRIIVAVVGPAIIKELRLTDLQFGLLGGLAFALLYSSFGVPIARLADRRHRVGLLALSVAVWSAMTVACGFARNYLQLLLYRMGVGIGEAGGTPAAHSIISDHFPASQRASALGIYSTGAPLGAMLGAVFGGWVAQHLGWRQAFFIVGAPGLALAALVWLTLREPPRGYADGVSVLPAPPNLRDVIRRLTARRSFVHAAAGCVLTTVAVTGILTFAPTYFVRQFDLGLAAVGALYGVASGVAAMAGMLTGGFGADWAARRDPRWYVWLPAIGVAAAYPLYLFGFSSHTVPAALTGIVAGGLAFSVYIAPTFGLTHNLVAPQMRASATALVLLAMNLFGQGLGPLALGWISDVAAAEAFSAGSYHAVCVTGQTAEATARECARAAAAGLRFALQITPVVLLWGAFHFLWAARFVRQDLQRSTE